jgi:hypothetical protein
MRKTEKKPMLKKNPQRELVVPYNTNRSMVPMFGTRAWAIKKVGCLESGLRGRKKLPWRELQAVKGLSTITQAVRTDVTDLYPHDPISLHYQMVVSKLPIARDLLSVLFPNLRPPSLTSDAITTDTYPSFHLAISTPNRQGASSVKPLNDSTFCYQLSRTELTPNRSHRCSLAPLPVPRPLWSPSEVSRPPALACPRLTTTLRAPTATFPSTPTASGSALDTGPSWPPVSSLPSALLVRGFSPDVSRFSTRMLTLRAVYQSYKTQ